MSKKLFAGSTSAQKLPPRQDWVTVVLGVLLTALFVGLPLLAVAAPSDGSLDTSFNIGATPGTNGAVLAIVVQPDGKILIGGTFTTVRGVIQNRIARLNADGSLDTTFNTGANVGTDDLVTAIALQPDGKIIVGGDFTTARGVTQNGIARLNADGSLDTTFNTGANVGVTTGVFASLLRAVAVQPDGKILIGGYFTTARGVVQNAIARLNADGSLDTSFNTGANVGTDLYVLAIAVQPDGKIIIGGDFSTVRGVTRIGSARLNADGSLDTSFTNTGTDPVTEASVVAIAVQPDGKILIGGNFTTARGVVQNRIARLNVDGSVDTSFNTGANPGTDSSIVNTVALQPDGKILIGGTFTTARGVVQNAIARLNADGSLDTSFNTGANVGTNAFVYAVAVQPDGKVLIGGDFTTARGVVQNSIARLGTATGGADLEVISYSGMPNPATAGQNVTFNLRFAQQGLGTASSVVLTIPVPANTTFVSINVPAGWSCTSPPIGATGDIVCTIASLGYGAIVDFQFTALVATGFSGTLTTTATVSSTTNDPFPANNSRTATVTVSAPNTTDLAVTGSANRTSVTPGQSVGYTFDVVNNGPSIAGNVTFTLNLPANTTFQSLTAPAGWSCTSPAIGGTGAVICNNTNSNFVSGTTANFILALQVNAGTPDGPIDTTGTVSSSTTTDPNPVNNSVTLRVVVGAAGAAAADLAITGNITPTTSIPGQNVTYNFTVSNNGPNATANINLLIDLPANTNFQSLTFSANWNCTSPAVGSSGGAVSCSSNNAGAGFGVGASQVFQLVLQINAAAPDGRIDLIIPVNGTTLDPNLANNSLTLSVTVGQQVEDKDKDKEQPDPSDVIARLRLSPDREVSTDSTTLITYTFSVQNIGKGRTGAMTLRFPIPSSLTLGYAFFGDDRAWVTNVLSDELMIVLPALDKDATVIGTIVFRPSGTAKAGDSFLLRYRLRYGDEVKPVKDELSNGVSLYWGVVNRDESNSNVQFLDLNIDGSTVTVGSRFFLADEIINLWLTDANGNSVALQAPNKRADKNGNYTFAVAVDVNGLNLAPGVYTLAAYGNRSLVTGAVTIRVETVPAAGSKAQNLKLKITQAPTPTQLLAKSLSLSKR
jgi:uncharacterized delta-60 repeat protein/uncharacterized repeat protein (TIGR01451 family)